MIFLNLPHMKSQQIKQSCRNQYPITKAVVCPPSPFLIQPLFLHLCFLLRVREWRAVFKPCLTESRPVSAQTAEEKQQMEGNVDQIAYSTREPEICWNNKCCKTVSGKVVSSLVETHLHQSNKELLVKGRGVTSCYKLCEGQLFLSEFLHSCR